MNISRLLCKGIGPQKWHPIRAVSSIQDGRVFCSTDTPELLVYGLLLKPVIEVGGAHEKK